MNKIRQIILLSVLLITLLTGFIFYEIKTYQPTYLVCAMPVPAYCGNPDIREDETKGREIFNSNCTACHKLDARSTGPALRNIDSLVITKWMIVKNHKIDSTKIEKLGLDYHRTMFKDFVNEENLALIVDYCSRTRY